MGTFYLRIRLYGSATSQLQEPIGVWDFGPINTSVKGLEVNLWTFDFYSMRLRTSTGTHLACSYSRAQETWVSKLLGLELDVVAPGVIKKSIFKADLAVPTGELKEMRRRFYLSSVPPIEWFFIELTNHCNHRCQWCPSPKMTREKGTMPLNRAKTLLEAITDYQQRNILLSMYAEIKNQIFLHVMGEPLLHPQLFEIIRYGHDLGLDFCLVTNMSLLNGERLHQLFECRLKNIIISLNVPDAAHFAKTQSPISYQMLIKRIQELVQERYRRGSPLPRIEIQLLNTKGVHLTGCTLVENPAQVEELLAFWSSFVREQERMAGVVSYNFDANEPSRWQTILEHDTNDPGIYFQIGQNIFLVFKRACNFANALLPAGAKLRQAHQGRCPFNNTHRTLCVLWDGSCTFCSLDYDNEVNLGNVFEEGIEAIWAGERMSRIRRLMEHGVLAEPLCRRCMGTFLPG